MSLLQGDGLVQAGYEITHGSVQEEKRLWTASYASDRESFIVAAAVSYNPHQRSLEPTEYLLNHLDYLLQQETFGPIKSAEFRAGDIHEYTLSVNALRNSYRRIDGVSIVALIGSTLALSYAGKGKVAIAGVTLRESRQYENISPFTNGELRTLREPVVVPHVGSLMVAFATSGNALPFKLTDSSSTAIIRAYNSPGAYITRQHLPVTEPSEIG